MSEAARFSGTPPASETFKPADVARYGELGFVELAGHTLTVRRSASPVEIDLRRASLSGTARDARVWTPKGELRLVPRRLGGRRTPAVSRPRTDAALARLARG